MKYIMFLTTAENFMNRFTVMLTHTHRDIMDDKEKIDKALARIAKILDEYKKHPDYYGYDVNKEWIDEHYDIIRNDLSDSTSSDEEKIKRALGEIYGQLISLLDMGHNVKSDRIKDLKKVKSILGQIYALEEKLQRFQRELRNWYG